MRLLYVQLSWLQADNRQRCRRNEKQRKIEREMHARERSRNVIYDKNIFRLIDIVRDSWCCDLKEGASNTRTQPYQCSTAQTYTTTGKTNCENDVNFSDVFRCAFFLSHILLFLHLRRIHFGDWPKSFYRKNQNWMMLDAFASRRMSVVFIQPFDFDDSAIA